MSIIKEFRLEDPSDNEGSHMLIDVDSDDSNNKYNKGKTAFIRAGGAGTTPAKPKKPLTVEEHLYNLTWYLRLVFLMLLVLLLLLIGTLVAIIVLMTTTATSPQFERAMRLVDKVGEMHDYTKTMTEVTTKGQERVGQAIVDYKVPEMIDSLKSMLTRGDEMLKALPTDVVQQASAVGGKLVQSLERVDFDHSNELIRHLNEWAASIDPAKVSTGVQQATSFLQKGTEILQSAQQTQLVERVGQFAAEGVELESRLKRLNELTIKLP